MRTRKGRRVGSQRGAVLVYVLVFLAILVAAIALLFELGPESTSAPRITALVAGLAAGAGLAYEARKDLDAALTFIAVVALCAAIFAIIYVVASSSRGAVPLTVAGGTLALAAGCGLWTWRRQRSEDPAFPNLLRSQFSDPHILETDGVQFVGWVEPSNEEKPHSIVFFLQNCFDGERRVSLRFDPGRYREYLRLYEEVQANLGPGEVVRVETPVVSPTYEGSYRLFFSLDVSGSSGKRVRGWRAQVPSRRVKGSQTAALLALGIVSWGGGTSFQIGPLAADLWNAELPEPRVGVVWKPERPLAPIAP